MQKLLETVSRVRQSVAARIKVAPAASPAQIAPGASPAQTVRQTTPLRSALESIQPLDFLFEPNIRQLTDAVSNTNDKASALAELATYFVPRPEKLKLLDNPYFLRRHSGNEVFDLMIAAGRYGLGLFADGQPLIERHAAQAVDPFFPMILSRFQYARGDRAGELQTIVSMQEKFPADARVALYRLMFERRNGNFDEANSLLEKVRNFVEPLIERNPALTEKSAADLVEAIEQKRLVRTGDFDIYDDDLTRQTWLGYYERYVTHSRFQSKDGYLIQKLDEELTEVIQSNSIGAVLDFGSLCAEIIARPAAKLPSTQFVGIDRQEFIATLNDEAYSLPNMNFESGDIFEYFPRFAELPGKKMFFHARTTCLLYPELVRQIYQAASDTGVDYIMGWEPNGLPRHHLRFYDFDDMPSIAIPHHGVMIAHNYKAILAEVGFEIEHVDHVSSVLIWPEVDDLVWSSLLFRAVRKRG